MDRIELRIAKGGGNIPLDGERVHEIYIDREPYEGEYTVEPTDEDQVLPTNGKRMTDDLTVLAGSGTRLEPATTDKLGGIMVGDDLLITEEGRLSVDKATSVEEDNTRPITAAAVYTEVGNINALLATI